MVLDIKAWLATFHQAECANTQAGAPGLVRHVLEREYPRLLSAGYELLPNVVVDLAHLYQQGESARFAAPANSPVSPEVLRPYCECLNAADGEGHLHRAIKRAHMLRWLEGGPGVEAKATLPGLFRFLQLASGFFPAVGDDALWQQVRQSWESAVVKDALSSGAPGAQSEAVKSAKKLLADFFHAFRKRAWQAASEAAGLLTLATARVPAAMEGLDLALLQACLEYRPLELDDPGTNRLPVGAISPRENRRSRSPECGNHGIDRSKGSPTAILRSLLAREDFIERYHRHELLYFKRHAPQLEPRRILLAWVIERSDPMCARVDGNRLRRDTAVLRLAAFTLEDVVRHLAWFPVLDLRVAVLLHNGERGEQLRGALLEPKLDELFTAPRADSQKQETWLPRLAAFMPHYFLREPIWPQENPFAQTSSGDAEPGLASGSGRLPEKVFDDTSPGHSPWARALKVLSRLALRSEINSFGESSTVFDLAHISLLGRGEELPATDRTRADLLHLLISVSGQSSLHSFSFDRTQIHWTPWPPLRDKTLKPDPGGYGYGPESLGRLRQGYWNDLVKRLLTL